MRRHRHTRPKHRMIAPWKPEFGDPAQVATIATYRGSAEHKDYPSPAGNPALRSDASRCDPRYTEFEPITEVLRTAIRRGRVGAIFVGGFPKNVWAWPTSDSMKPATSSGHEAPTRPIHWRKSNTR